MDIKVKRKYGKKVKKRSLEKQNLPRTLKISKIFGIEKLFLSPLTQQILDCRVGINITPQEPWIFIPKEKILENIELHDHSSELLPIKEQIESYPDDKVLIGCYGHEQDVPEEFMVCTTLDTTQLTLDILQAQEAAIHQKIIESIVKVCGTWDSLGSEAEVEENMIHCFRKPFQVHLTSETANFFVQCKFTFRFVADSPDGYVELKTPRQEFKNIIRKRIHSYAQSSAFKVNAVTQTIMEPVVNKTTGCEYLLKPRKIVKGALENFIAKLDEKFVLDLLQTNYYMDLCRNDYIFPGAFHGQIFKFPLCILSFQDVFSCRRKRVSCVSWNAMKSGIVAASYVKQQFTMILREDLPHNSLDIVHGNHVVLVWSYTDVIKPLLYLHCFREVTVVSFCSHNANIVVGGCDNGQIVVWDISGRMERAGVKKVLTKMQQEHRFILENYMRWMKKPPEVQHVYPVILSKIEVSHLSPISYIEWLPPDQYITKNGKYEKSKDDDIRLQFLSCYTENGCIDVWDIRIPEDSAEKTTKKRVIRLTKVPDALTKYVSPFKALGKNFIPIYRLSVSNPNNRKPLSICKLLERQGHIIYRALNPETEFDVYRRTDFERVNEPGRIENLNEHNFICATAFGEVCSFKWVGFEYDQGCLVNSNAAEVGIIRTYHDGPIIVCIESPIIKKLFLTVGGSVFAIWNAKNLNVPLFWRKSSYRYVTGSWLTAQPFQIGLARYDTFKEIWDLMADSKKPLKIIKGKGRATDGLFNDFRRMHAKKGTFVETNVAGEIKIYSIPFNKRDIKGVELNAVITYLEDLERRREMLINWTDKLKSKFDQIVIETEQIGAEATAVEKVLPIQETMQEEKRKNSVKKNAVQIMRNQWQAKEEAFMWEVLIANKHMNLDQITKNSDLVRQAKILRQKHAVKFAEQLKNKDKNLQNWRMLLIPDQQFTKKEKITVTFSKDMSQYMKQSYIQIYNDIEKATLADIGKNPYKFIYNWPDLHKRARISYTACTHFRTKMSKYNNVLPIG